MDKRSDICTAERISQLERAMQSIERGLQTPQPKIQRVDNQLRGNPNFAKYYLPRLLSIGPIHHGKENLKLGEHYKLIWTAMYLKESKQNPHNLRQKIEQHIEEVKGLYTEDAIGDYSDNNLVGMLFVDGCSVLQIMQKFDSLHPEKLWIKLDQQERVLTDLHLLENQIPYKVLELLSIDEKKLLSSMLNIGYGGFVNSAIFLDSSIQVRHSESRLPKTLENLFLEDLERSLKPNHLLDLVHLIFLKIDEEGLQDKRKQETEIQVNDDREHRKEVRVFWNQPKNVRELKAAGIRVQKKDTRRLSNVSFVSKFIYGELRLPWFYMDDSAPYISLNMMAYEKCPDFHNNYEICSYLAFLDTLIDDANDVKELRLAGVIANYLGSDEEVAKLLNGIGTELASKGFYELSAGSGKMAYSEKYAQVKNEIEKHCRKKWKTWLAQAYNTYFSNPWSICAFLAAALALVLTSIQTWLAIIHPNK